MKHTLPGSETEVRRVAVGPFQVNTFFLHRRGESDTVVIDPGDESERLFAIVEENGWRPVAILNTHAHLDHIGAVQAFRTRFDIPFHLDEKDRFLLEAAPDHARMFGITPPEIPPIDRPLDGTGTITLAGMRIETIHTPGHSPGSVCFRVDGRLFAGDLVFQGSIGRTDLPGGDFETIAKSLREELLTLPDETVLHCGHGPDTTVGEERKNNPFLLEL